MLIVAPVFVSQYQINCLKNSWHKEGKSTNAPFSGRASTQMGRGVAAGLREERKPKRLERISTSRASCLAWSEAGQCWQQLRRQRGVWRRLQGGAFWKAEQVADRASVH